jgi:hypothetical protein
MARRKVEGKCHICGTVGKLSFEHVPPKGAFNNKQVVRVGFDEAITLGPYDRLKGSIEQRGAGAYTLCERCNNNTGSWYAAWFADWCVQGAKILIAAFVPDALAFAPEGRSCLHTPLPYGHGDKRAFGAHPHGKILAA